MEEEENGERTTKREIGGRERERERDGGVYELTSCVQLHCCQKLVTIAEDTVMEEEENGERTIKRGIGGRERGEREREREREREERERDGGVYELTSCVQLHCCQKLVTIAEDTVMEEEENGERTIKRGIGGRGEREREDREREREERERWRGI